MKEQHTNIRFTNGWRLEYTGRDWCLYKPVVKKAKHTGIPYDSEAIHGYYSTPEAAVRTMARELMGYFGETNVEELMVKLSEMMTQISDDIEAATSSARR